MLCANCVKLAFMNITKTCIRCNGQVFTSVSVLCDTCSATEKKCSVCIKTIGPVTMPNRGCNCGRK